MLVSIYAHVRQFSLDLKSYACAYKMLVHIRISLLKTRPRLSRMLMFMLMLIMSGPVSDMHWHKRCNAYGYVYAYVANKYQALKSFFNRRFCSHFHQVHFVGK